MPTRPEYDPYRGLKTPPPQRLWTGDDKRHWTASDKQIANPRPSMIGYAAIGLLANLCLFLLFNLTKIALWRTRRTRERLSNREQITFDLVPIEPDQVSVAQTLHDNADRPG